MSQWFEPEKEDLSMSDDGKELHALIDRDNQGAIYVSIKVEDIKKLLEEKS